MSGSLPYPPPRLVFFETTAVCNLHCQHCRRPASAGTVSYQDLSTEEAKRLVDEVASWGRRVLILSGGEPLLRPDIYVLASRASASGLIVGLATNATLIDGQVAQLIKKSGINRVSVSLDGADAATHDAFRRATGSFAAALAGIGALREAGVPLQINVTVAKHNVHQLNEMVLLAKEIGAEALHLFLLVPVGCGLEIADEQMISAQAYEETLNWLYETELREDQLELRATCAPHYFRIVRQRGAPVRHGCEGNIVPSLARQLGVATSDEPGLRAEGHLQHSERDECVAGPLPEFQAATRGCLAGTGVCFVSHEGKVFGCGYLPIEAGDFRRESLMDIWRSSPLFTKLRDLKALKGKCGRCSFKTVCGGCRARAYGVTGDYLAEEPFCIYQPPKSTPAESTPVRKM